MKINNSAVGAKLAINPLFPDLLSKISMLPVGETFTVRGCFSDIEWEKQSKEIRLSLGRLFKNNVDNGNITGVQAIIRKSTNNTQRYRIVGHVSFIEKFMMNYLCFYDNYAIFTQELYQSKNDAILYYIMHKNDNILDLEIICKKINSQKEVLFTFSKEIKIPNNLNPKSPNIPSIIAIWFSLTILWLNEKKLDDEGIQNIVICSSNRSMLERCSGYRTDTANNQDYEIIIQDYFKNFILGNQMQLNYNINAISLDHNTYNKLIRNF